MAKTAESELLKAVLKSLGLSARAAGEKLGIPASRIENWTCGRSAAPVSCWSDLWYIRLEMDAEQAAEAERVKARVADIVDLVQRTRAKR